MNPSPQFMDALLGNKRKRNSVPLCHGPLLKWLRLMVLPSMVTTMVTN